MSAEQTSLDALVAELTLEEKVGLISGQDFWTTTPIERIGLRSIVLSDGPAGVRGPEWDERSPSLNLPSATALAASWDPDLAYRYGAVAAGEARRKGVDVVLGPTINLQRSPLGGRHFECFSEDPFLSGSLAAAYVRGLQDNGVAATPKHYVANDSETDRFTVNVSVDERALRELYLLPFEFAVEAGAWAVMSAYNSVDGVTMTENDLLEEPLKTEWGFDGVVVSDWTAVRSLASAGAAQDLAMPGPAEAWSAALVNAVRAGRLDESLVDTKVRRLLLLAQRVGALQGPYGPRTEGVAEDGRSFAREAAIAGTVLLENRAELPWDAPSIRSIAVLGQNADLVRTQGGGSATVIPETVVSPLDALREALPDAEVRYEVGAIVQEGVVELPLAQITNPHTAGPGVRVTFHDEAGTEIFAQDRQSTALVWFGGGVPLADVHTIVLETDYQPTASEERLLGFASSNHGRLFVNGVLVVEETPVLTGTDLGAALLAPPSVTARVKAQAGVPLRIRGEFELSPEDNPLAGAAAVTVGFAPAPSDPDELIARAAAAAAAADVALVVVGTNAVVESEGYDRESLDLPGRQDELVRAVVAANPRTVVVVNAGAPVLLPWRKEVAGILLTYFGGQEIGSALTAMLLGSDEPGGKLTTTWPAAVEDVPVLAVAPVNGTIRYAEGIHVGYRAWLAADTLPAYPFGWGLGYTTWRLGDPGLHGAISTGDAAVRIPVTNTGERSGKQVVQVYAERPESAIDRPVRWLVGSAVVAAPAGGTVEAVIPIRSRAFAHWEGGRSGSWRTEPGVYTLRIGTSVTDLHNELEVRVPGSEHRDQ